MPTKSSNSNSAGIASPAPVLSASSRRQIRHFPLTLYSTFTVPIGIVTPLLLPLPALLPTFDAIIIPIASSMIPSNSFRTLTPFRLLSFRSRVSSIISGRAWLDKGGLFCFESTVGGYSTILPPRNPRGVWDTHTGPGPARRQSVAPPGRLCPPPIYPVGERVEQFPATAPENQLRRTGPAPGPLNHDQTPGHAPPSRLDQAPHGTQANRKNPGERTAEAGSIFLFPQNRRFYFSKIAK